MGGGSGGNSLEIMKSVMVHVCCASRAEILVGAPRAVMRRVAAATKLVVNFILNFDRAIEIEDCLESQLLVLKC
jgi:hypothetical protein